MTDFISDIPPKNDIIIGADLNAIISTKLLEDKEENDVEDSIYKLILALQGNSRQTDSESLERDMMRDLDLTAVRSVFFDCNGKHDTWIHLVPKQPYQLDHILIPTNQLSKVMDIKRKFDRPPRDHAAIMLTYR